MCFQQNQDYDTIPWKLNERLSWTDFKGDIPSSSRAAATTASGITYRYSTNGNPQNFEVEFKVDAYFYPHKSWYNPALCDTLILGHEQLHFDISEIYARKLKQRLNESTFNRTNIRSKVREIYNAINQELDAFQNQYDRETNFSRNIEKQLLWNAKIDKALKSE